MYASSKAELVFVCLSISVHHALSMTLFVRSKSTSSHEGPLTKVTRVRFPVQMDMLVDGERREHGEGFPANITLERLFILLVNKLMDPEMSQMHELPLAHITLIGSLFEMGPLVSPETLHPREPLPAPVATVRLLTRVDVLMTPQIAKILEPESATVADVGFLARMHPLVHLQILFLGEALSTALTLVRALACMNIVVHFEMRDMGEDPAADLALVEFLLTALNSMCLVDMCLVLMLAVALLVDYVVPVRLETLPAHLAFERFLFSRV